MQSISGIIYLILIACLLPYVFTIIAKKTAGFRAKDNQHPREFLAKMIGSALVGTFLGILLAYGVVEPLGGLVEQKTEDAAKELQCIKSTLLASMQGYNPATAIEFGRKVLFSDVRPSFSDLGFKV